MAWNMSFEQRKWIHKWKILHISIYVNWCMAAHRAEEESRAAKFNFIVDYKMSWSRCTQGQIGKPSPLVVSDLHVIWENMERRARAQPHRRRIMSFLCVLSPKKKVNFKILFISSGPFESMSPASVHNYALFHLFSALTFTQSSNWIASLCFHCIITYNKKTTIEKINIKFSLRWRAHGMNKKQNQIQKQNKQKRKTLIEFSRSVMANNNQNAFSYLVLVIVFASFARLSKICGRNKTADHFFYLYTLYFVLSCALYIQNALK